MPEYLEVVEAPRRMGGKGAPKDTLFGVIGHTAMNSMTRSLGGLVIGTTKDASPKDSAMKASSAPKNTEKHLLGGSHATALPGVHYGQIPYAGMYMKAVGARTS
jgi:hypothetical protein